MIRVLIVIPSFGSGGATTSLINLLPFLATNDRKIDVFPITPEGEYYREVIKYAHILAPIANKQEGHNGIKSRFYSSASQLVKRIKRGLIHLGIDISPVVFKRVASRLSKEKYDYVIAFQEGQATRLVKYIKAVNKIAWIHSIYSRFSSERKNSHYLKDYSSYDRIICVSNTAAEDMKKCLPALSRRIKVVYNALNYERIIEKSEDFTIKNDLFTIISVGRIDPVKRFSRIPEIARVLIDKGVVFQWIIVGGVADEVEKRLLIKNISKNNVTSVVKWIGPQFNPYPYIASSDLYVCLSSSETFNYTIAEAKVLGVPVISTDFPAAKEFIEDKETGLISSVGEVASSIFMLKNNSVLYNKIRQNAKKRSLDWNNTIIEQINTAIFIP